MSSNFSDVPRYEAGQFPGSVTTADVNGDGALDVLTANFGGTASLLLGNGDGTFQTKRDIVVGSGATSVALADLDGDGKLDIVASRLDGTVSVLSGNGDGSFRTAQDYAVGASPNLVTVADVDGDGFLDLVTANLDGNSVSVLRGQGYGTFGTAVDYATGARPDAVAVVDVDGDGRKDLVTSNFNDATVSVLHGNGDGTFGAHQDLDAGTDPLSLVAVDLNKDGKVDLVTANMGGNSVSVRLGNGDGTFGARQAYDVGLSVSSVVATDVNGDGTLDLVATNRNSNTVSVLVGRGDGTFYPSYYGRRDYLAGPAPIAVAAADVNGDHAVDVVTANDDGTVSVLLGNGDATLQAPPVLTTQPNPLVVVSGDFNADGYADFVTTYGTGINVVLNTGNTQLTETGYNPVAIAAADLNRDGRTDLVVANAGSNTISVLMTHRLGGFLPKVDFATSAAPVSVAISDLNRDGRDDILVASADSTVSVLLGTAGGGFQPFQTFFPTNRDISSITTADVNRDGKADLIATNRYGGSVSVLLGNGNGSFQAYQDFETGVNPVFVTTTDANRDGKLDLVTVNAYDGTVSVLLGDGTGQFATKRDYATGVNPRSAVASDLDGDGKVDLVVANADDDTVSVLYGNGDGTFQPKQDFAVGAVPTSVAIAHANGDGRPDILASGYAASGVTILTNQSKDAVTTIGASLASGATAGIGTRLTFTVGTEAPVTVTGIPQLVLSNGTVANYIGQSSDGRMQFAYDVAGGDDTNDLKVTGLSLNGGSISPPAKLEFAGRRDVATGDAPTVVKAADVNGDGKADLIVANTDGGTVSILLGDGAGSFQPKRDLGTFTSPRALVVADFNRDGKLDLAVSCDKPGSNPFQPSVGAISLMLGDGDGTFTRSELPSMALDFGDIAAADLNADGKADLVYVTGGSISLSLGNGDGTFSGERVLVDDVVPQNIGLLDANADGKADLVFTDTSSASVSVMLGNGDGTFQARTTYQTAAHPTSLVIPAASGNHVSIVLTEANGDVETLANNYYDGSFTGPYTVGENAGSAAVAIADLDGDGRTDTIVANAATKALSIFRGDGSGAKQEVALGFAPGAIAVADVDRDGRPDLVVTDAAGDKVAVLLNTSVAAATFDASGIAHVPGADTGIRIDTQGPPAPTLAPSSDSGASSSDKVTRDTTPTVTGVAAAGATVALYDGTRKVGSAVAASSGSFSVTSSVLGEGVHALSVTITPRGGATGPRSAPLVVTIDSKAPPAPAAPGLDPASDSGRSSSDAVTADVTPTLAGTAEAGATVLLYDGTKLVGAAQADGATGAYSVTAASLAAGTHKLTVRALDVAGNLGAASSARTVVIDTRAPLAPGVPSLSSRSDTGRSSVDGVTAYATPTLTGKAEAGALVTLYDSDGATSLGSALAASNGAYAITAAPLADGTHVLRVRATDKAGNVGALSGGRTIVVDTQAPAAPAAPTLAPASDTGASSADGITRDTTPTLTGFAEAGATVTLYEGARRLGSTTAGADGAYAVTSLALAAGVHTLSVTATDKAGNVGPTSPGQTLLIDTQAPARPAAPVLAAGSDSGASASDGVTQVTTPTLTGTVEAGARVTLYDGTRAIGTTLADAATGAYDLTTPVLAAGTHRLAVRATDAAGNVGALSAARTVIVDTRAPSTSITSAGGPVTQGSRTISGRGEAGTTVTLSDNGAATGQPVVVKANGTWSAAISFADPGTHSIVATGTDRAGNAGTSAAVAYDYEPSAGMASLHAMVQAMATTNASASSDPTPTSPPPANDHTLAAAHTG